MPQGIELELVPTILDRLVPVDYTANEIGSRRRGGEQDLADSIARDLYILLNTRREEALIPPEFEESAKSILNFGVPDFATCGSLKTSQEQAKLCRWIEEAIRNFEPRLRNVNVRVLDPEHVNPVLRFRVEAKAEFASDRLAFDMGLKRDTGEVAIVRG